MLLKLLDRWLTNHNWRVVINAAQANCSVHSYHRTIGALQIEIFTIFSQKKAVECASTGQRISVTLYTQSILCGSVLLGVAEYSRGSERQISEKGLINC